MMVSLRTFQEEIKHLVFFKDPEATRSRLWKDQIPERLNVYRNNTRSNWTDTLDHDFPLTRRQFSETEWDQLRKRYFIKHPPQHWELNASMTPFVQFLKTMRNVGAHRCAPYVKELADYEWNDLKVFIDRAVLKRGSGITNPTAVIRAYQYQIFFWVEAGAPPARPPSQKPEVLVFYRDSRNTCHIQEADPLMILLMDHFKKSGACLQDLEPARRTLLPANQVPLRAVFENLQKSELLL
jgi:hypothetical protein